MDTNIKGIVDLVGCATLNDKYLAIVKLNVKEYANDEAKIYDNKVLTIKELTVVDRVGLPDAEASSDSTSSAVSSEYIISRFRKLVKENEKKVQMSLAEDANQQAAGDIDALIKSAGIEGEATEIRENFAELYRVAAEADADERMVARSAKTLAMSMVSEGALRNGETRDEAVARLQKEILSRTEFAEKEGARQHFLTTHSIIQNANFV